MAYVMRIAPKDYELSRVQDLLADAIDRIGSAEIVNGRHVGPIVLSSGATSTINHGLGRNLRGYIVTRRSTDCRVWDDVSTAPSKTLILRTSATATVSLWVY